MNLLAKEREYQEKKKLHIRVIHIVISCYLITVSSLILIKKKRGGKRYQISYITKLTSKNLGYVDTSDQILVLNDVLY